MPVLNPPSDPSKILVEVPLPQPVVSQPRQPAPQPVQQQPTQPEPEPDPFRQIKGPPVMILPHVAIQGKDKMGRKGKPVRMSKKHWNTPEFKEWFGDSQVRKKDGSPLVVYHGSASPHDFSEFSVDGPPNDENNYDSGSGSDPSALLGANFAVEPNVASGFALRNGASWMRSRYTEGKTAAKVYPVYLSIGKPKRYGSEEELQSHLYRQKLNHPDLDMIAEDSDDPDEFYSRYEDDDDFREDVNRDLISNAETHSDGEYDAAKDIAHELASSLRSELESQGHDGIVHPNQVEGGTTWIAFRPHQIKSAISNRGAYDKNDPDVRMARKQESNTKKSKLSRFRSPAGGMVVRGMFYPGGKMLPKEATEANPKPNTKAKGKKKKKKKAPVDTFLPEVEPYEMKAKKKKKMSRKGKPTKFAETDLTIPKVLDKFTVKDQEKLLDKIHSTGGFSLDLKPDHPLAKKFVPYEHNFLFLPDKREGRSGAYVRLVPIDPQNDPHGEKGVKAVMMSRLSPSEIDGYIGGWNAKADERREFFRLPPNKPIVTGLLFKHPFHALGYTDAENHRPVGHSLHTDLSEDKRADQEHIFGSNSSFGSKIYQLKDRLFQDDLRQRYSNLVGGNKFIGSDSRVLKNTILPLWNEYLKVHPNAHQGDLEVLADRFHKVANRLAARPKWLDLVIRAAHPYYTTVDDKSFLGIAKDVDVDQMEKDHADAIREAVKSFGFKVVEDKKPEKMRRFKFSEGDYRNYDPLAGKTDPADKKAFEDKFASAPQPKKRDRLVELLHPFWGEHHLGDITAFHDSLPANHASREDVKRMMADADPAAAQRLIDRHGNNAPGEAYHLVSRAKREGFNPSLGNSTSWYQDRLGKQDEPPEEFPISFRRGKPAKFNLRGDTDFDAFVEHTRSDESTPESRQIFSDFLEENGHPFKHILRDGDSNKGVYFNNDHPVNWGSDQYPSNVLTFHGPDHYFSVLPTKTNQFAVEGRIGYNHDDENNGTDEEKGQLVSKHTPLDRFALSDLIDDSIAYNNKHMNNPELSKELRDEMSRSNLRAEAYKEQLKPKQKKMNRKGKRIKFARLDHEPFAKTIAESRLTTGDQTPSLVFADYLEENGNPAHRVVRKHVDGDFDLAGVNQYPMGTSLPPYSEILNDRRSLITINSLGDGRSHHVEFIPDTGDDTKPGLPDETAQNDVWSHGRVPHFARMDNAELYEFLRDLHHYDPKRLTKQEYLETLGRHGIADYEDADLHPTGRKMKRKGKAIMFGRVEQSEVHADYQPNGIAPRIGHVLGRLAAEGDGSLQPDHALLAESILKTGNHEALPILADALDESNHPLKDEFNWRHAPRAIEIDRAMTNMIRGKRISRDGIRRQLAPGWLLVDWANSYKPAITKKKALDTVRLSVPDVSKDDLVHSLIRLRDIQFGVIPEILQSRLYDEDVANEYREQHSKTIKKMPSELGSNSDGIDKQHMQNLGVKNLESPHRYPDTRQSQTKMKRKGKPTKMSREAKQAVDHLAPIVQQDPNNEDARGILADALEETGLHHDPETLDHLRNTQYPVYGIVHPASGKWVFSPRRSWLIEQFAKSHANQYGTEAKFNHYQNNHQQFSDLLHSIGLHGHAEAFDSYPDVKDRSGYWIKHSRTVYDGANRVGGADLTTFTPGGFVSIHGQRYLEGESTSRISQEQAALAEEDRLHG